MAHTSHAIVRPFLSLSLTHTPGTHERRCLCPVHMHTHERAHTHLRPLTRRLGAIVSTRVVTAIAGGG